jgi:hypothetical protein
MPEDKIMSKGPKNFIESLLNVIVFSPRDWGENHEDAWIWGIIVGWDKPALQELREKFNWNRKTVKRLQKLHSQVEKCKEKTS